ncbi:4-hydroxyphenylpyruvate dioxygenase [Chitinophaga nivalis]|uniref:4-hydroxyphenylpyruvate dioxygenase n=1 Tax=Chitinophaga nivalis TaxID=2991709 RepID=A0ABT3IK74_9BACT|nr:4-hydroxyphenylpyruvate dioxygenase [Chitinophaga nivalis]MCW3465951.1 4-hydroxyphenylpyruvate dioxygenase [Chitinophaga nivalis]MCW3484358.1 4-hydroxyphenylpyruvate dioxygenase [Chitinophaga nivalis]
MENPNGIIPSDFLTMEYDYIEYYVGMAKMVVYWHVKALGFKVVAYSGPETGAPDRCSYYIVKNDIKLVITAASQPSSYKIVSFVDLHGNGIKKLAVKVNQVREFFQRALKNGAIPLQHPHTLTDEQGSVEMASLKMFDDNEIVLINYDQYNGDFMPGYKNIEQEWDEFGEDTALEKIDHVACALRLNEINLWENYFNHIFNSKTVKQFDERKKDGEKKIGMLLKVLQSENKQVNNVLVEPDHEIKSQVSLFIDQHYGAGIQHIAFSSGNIFKSVETLRANGVRFTSYPDSYYKKLSAKYPDLDITLLKKHGVLCDVLDGALLFQIFTTPIGDRATFFYEIVQRVNNYEGFGLDNIHALFEAMETELMANSIS